MRRVARRSVALAALPLLAGCITSDVRLEPKHVEAHRAVAPARGCRMAAFELVDARPMKALGRFGQHEFSYDGLHASVEAALQRAAAVDAHASPLRIELARAHLENHPSGHSFNLVLRARSDDAPWRVYRGLESGITWWGSDAEFGEYVRRAADEAAAKLAAGEGVCEPGGRDSGRG